MTSINDIGKVLTTRGYAIRKSILSSEDNAKIRRELTVSPVTQSRLAIAGNPFSVYFESPQRYYLPRHWARDVFGPEEVSVLPEGKPLSPTIQFQGKAFDYQEKIIQQFLDAGSNGLICVPCGKGKTFMALNIAARIGKRFLVVVDKEFLLNQWKGEMEQFFPGLRIGIIQENKKQIGLVEEPIKKELTIAELKERLKSHKLPVSGNKDVLVERLRKVEPLQNQQKQEHVEYDCCIAMIQTIVRRDFAKDDFHSFGFAIFDECHHLGASNFSQALAKIQTKYMLGLSATPIRDDGLTKVFEWFLGKPVYWEKRREADKTVTVKALMFTFDEPSYTEIPVDYKDDVVLARLLTQVVSCVPRNEWISKQILELLKEPARRILVLAERIVQLEQIEKILQTVYPKISTGYYIGGMKEEVRERDGREAKVLLASYSMASEAMNIKSLNTVVLASPRKKIEQSVGRILRERPSERQVDPLIIDIVDSHGMYIGQWRKRKSFYKACGYKILVQKYNSEEISDSSDSDHNESRTQVQIQNNCCLIVEENN
uniref:Helicase ATP-binding domain-containing protein n=1 Tax=viral metagenome TaxID=1070528 RepID=A0A6C0HEL6_9ZZZZ